MHGAKYRNAARTCDVIFVNSEFTKGEVVELLGVPEEKVVVAYPGVDERFRAEGERADLGRPYVLTVATLEPRKNLETLLAAPAARGARARRRRRGGLGPAAGARPARRDPARLRRRRASSPSSTAARPRSSTRRASRASGSRSSRRWRAACRSSPRRTRRWTRRRATRPSAPTRTTRRRSSAALAEAAARGATSSSRAGSRTRAPFTWAATGRAMLEAFSARLRGARRDRRLAARPDARRHGALPPRPPRPERVRAARVRRAGPRWRRSCATRGGTRSRCPGEARGASRSVLHCPTFRGPFSTARSRWSSRSTTSPSCATRGCSTSGRGATAALPFRGWCRRRGAVIAVSEFTKRELVELLRTSPENGSRVIPNAVEEPFTPDGPRAEGDYVLAVGTLEPRKNLARVVAGCAARSVSSCGWSAREGWGGVEVDGWVGRVSDEELAALYRGARCLVYPSLYEGFGHPGARGDGLRDAGRHVSAGGATEEVAGGAAVLVDPLDVDAIAAGHRGGGCARATSCAPLGLERARGLLLGPRRRRDLAPSTRRRRVTPLVVIDADVLGRQRTGDETYVENLLRRLPALAGDEFALRRDHPAARPRARRRRAGRAAGALPGAADGCSACRGCFAACARRSRTSSTALPLRWRRPGGRHRARPLVRAGRDGDGPPSTARSSSVVVPRSVRRARHVIAVSERTKRDLVELYACRRSGSP